MALSTKLEMRHSQQLVMTPQLQQAIRLLQLSNLELDAFVDQELERNPLLERDETQPEATQADQDPAPEILDAAGDDGLDGADPGDAFDDAPLLPDAPLHEAASLLDTEVDNVYPDTAPTDLVSDQPQTLSRATLSGQSGDGESLGLESVAAAERSLKDHLSEQAPLALADPVERLVGQYLVDLVDEAGYLTADLDEVAVKLGVPLEFVATVLDKLQRLDPAGVFARSLAECLMLQLRERDRFDPIMARLVANLDLLATHKLASLRRLVGVELDELGEMIAELKELDPKPGLRFGSAPMQPVVPDVIVRPSHDGGWRIELNSDTLPRVLVNRSYYTRVARNARTTGERTYIHDCLQTANWLVKSLDQRARTILKVSEEIVRQQDAFFAYGVQHLRPLNLRAVADAISMHESTVSRVTSNKYMATSRGIFELKYFFTSSIPASGEGEAHSSEAVRHRIRQMIDAETARTVLSDDKIVDKLKRDGVDIARRTVAKYREAMRIPSSVQRRREKLISDRPRA